MFVSRSLLIDIITPRSPLKRAGNAVIRGLAADDSRI